MLSLKQTLKYKQDIITIVYFFILSISIGLLIKDYHSESGQQNANNANYQKDFASKPEIWKGLQINQNNNEIKYQLYYNRIEIYDVWFSGNVGYTDSMLPTIYGGNKLIEKKYPFYQINQEGNCPGLKPGQIISFINKYNNDRFGEMSKIETVHRIIDNNLNNGQLRTKGDNADGTEYVLCEDIHSIIVGVLYT